MVCSNNIWLILLFLQVVFATKGESSGGDGDTIVSVTMTMTSGTTVIIPANGTGTATQSSIQPAVTSSAPLISVPIIPNATTCMPMTFTWQVIPPTFNGTNVDVRLAITNNDVKPLGPQPNNRKPPTNVTSVTRCITNTALSTGFYNWSAVTVPPGWYILDVSTDPPMDISAQSQKFFVAAGSNTSCVFANSSISPVQTNSHFTSGALAGTVAGSVVGAAALIGACLLPRLWRRGVPGHKAWKVKRGLYKVF